MPTYAYHCENCKTNSEFSQKITDEPLKICPSCEMPSLKRGPGGGIGLSLKGADFILPIMRKAPLLMKLKVLQQNAAPAVRINADKKIIFQT